MPSVKDSLSNLWTRQQRGQQRQQQKNRGQAVPPSANSYTGGYPPQSMENAHQYSRHGPARSLLEGSEQPAITHRSGRATSRNSTQRTPEHRVESAAPVKDERSREELSESRVREEEQRGASRHQVIGTTPVRQHKKPRNQKGSRDKERPVLAEDYSNSETRFANSERLDSNVSGQSIESRFPPNSHLQINLGNEFKFPEANSPMLDMAATLPNEENPEEHHTGGEQLQRDDHKPGSAPSDPKNRDEAKYDESGKLRTGGIIRRLVDGEHQRRRSRKPTQISPNHTDQVQDSEEMHKLQIDHAIEMNAIQKNHQAELAMLKENHDKSIENEKQAMDELYSKLKFAQEQNSHLLQQLESKSGDLEIAQQAWEKSKMDINDKSKKLQSTREEADRLTRLLTECTSQIHKLEQSLAEAERQLAISEQTRAEEQLQHADAVATLSQKIRTAEANFNEQVSSLIGRQTQETDQLQNTHEAEISRLVQEHNAKIDLYQQDIESVETKAEKKRQKLVLAHHEQLAQLMDKHERTVAQMKAELAQLAGEEEEKRQNLTASHDEQRTQIFKEHEQALSRINEELAEVRQDKELKISQLKEAHAAELAQKDMNYAQGTRQLREDIQRLNAALLTRDDQLYQGELFTTSNLPTRPDEQIRAKFSEIEQMVDSIGRLQWKQEPAVWTSEVLRSVGGNITDRVLKKAIVQDLVWCLLFTHIFCSPFRVFGVEGRLLEEEWNEQCGQDGDSNEQVFSWPEPGAKTERWRYMTVKECREVLLPPVPSEWDPRMRLRKGFMDNYKESMSELKASLEQIADLTPADIKMIERLLKKAAAVWLDFAIHRCRIVIRLKDSAALSMEEKVTTAQSSSLELTVVPAVGRYGNVTGADLDMYKTIDRCAGESIVIPS